ncbi:hypothetical protein ACJ72_04214 [Emergomyces africanus]|uniref:Hydrophobin n=1 Tax=Emergomyces africanus TaxID=1955775 RepID=A0A1B7NXF7_9EURO|nr:hypothetical protein ACJ72_04214 [Emergomyces africanus]
MQLTNFVAIVALLATSVAASPRAGRPQRPEHPEAQSSKRSPALPAVPTAAPPRRTSEPLVQLWKVAASAATPRLSAAITTTETKPALPTSSCHYTSSTCKCIHAVVAALDKLLFSRDPNDTRSNVCQLLFLIFWRKADGVGPGLAIVLLCIVISRFPPSIMRTTEAFVCA